MSAEKKYSRVIRAKTGTAGAQRAGALLPHEVVGRLADGRLPLALADADLKVSITLDMSVTDPSSRTAYKLIVDGGPPIDASERVLLPTEFVPGTKVDALLPLSYMVTEGDFLLDYATYTTAGENEERAYLPIRIIVDRSSPGGAHLGPLTFSTVPDDLLTESDLVGDKLPGTVNDWFGMAAQDTATAWIAPGRTPAPGDWRELPSVKHEVVVPGEEVTFNFDKIAVLPDDSAVLAQSRDCYSAIIVVILWRDGIHRAGTALDCQILKVVMDRGQRIRVHNGARRSQIHLHSGVSREPDQNTATKNLVRNINRAIGHLLDEIKVQNNRCYWIGWRRQRAGQCPERRAGRRTKVAPTDDKRIGRVRVGIDRYLHSQPWPGVIPGDKTMVLVRRHHGRQDIFRGIAEQHPQHFRRRQIGFRITQHILELVAE